MSNALSQGDDSWDPDAYNKVASFVYSKEYTSPVLRLLDARRGERILDFGCGSGELTLELQRIVGENGVVVGVDASENMIKKSRQNGLRTCFVADVQELKLPPVSSIAEDLAGSLPGSFDYKFDAVFSNAALHWCKRDPYGVVRSASGVLRKGGRFVGEMGGYMNIVGESFTSLYRAIKRDELYLGLRSAMHTAMRRHGYNPEELDPWYFPSNEDYKKVLESAGFRVTHLSHNPRLTPLSSNIIEWQRMFCRGTFYASLTDEEAEVVIREVQEICAVDCKDAGGNWSIMYCRLRFAAVLD